MKQIRIGEFLKDIDLSEKQSTGITKILRELQKNGSPEPEFETDEDRTYLITTIRCREGFAHGRMGESMGESMGEWANQNAYQSANEELLRK